MFLCCEYFIIVGCSSDQAKRKPLASDDVTHLYDFNLDYFYEILGNVAVPFDHNNINDSLTEAESTTVNNNECALNSDNFQENSDKDSFSFKNFIDDNSMIQSAYDENISFKTYNRSNKYLSTFTTPESQNDAVFHPPVRATEIGNAVECSKENENKYELSDILNQVFQVVFDESEIDEKTIQSEECTSGVIKKNVK